MNKELVREASALPSYVVEMFANELGVDWTDINSLMELQAIIIEEIVDKDVDSTNIFTAFNVVRDSVSERWTKWLKGSFSDAHGV